MFSFLNRFRHFDIPLLAATLLLLAVGLSLLYSTTYNSEIASVFTRQIWYATAGLVALFTLSFIDYHQLTKMNRVGYVIGLALLAYLLAFGFFSRGGRRSVYFFFFTIQVAEFVKIIVILGLARLLYLRRGSINAWSNILWSLVYIGIPVVLILLEPDLGSALVIVGIWAGVMVMSPLERKYVIILCMVAAIGSGLTWKFALKPFQKDRILVFLNPDLDPRGRGYNVRQATIAVGSGSVLGRGLGRGLQSQHRFLPERQTDFIFAASAEELGFIGTVGLLGLFMFLFFRIIRLIRAARDDLGSYIAAGIFFFLFVHTVVNVGMNVGLLPVTGIPLPLVSAGGSNLVATLAALGILQNIAIQTKALRF